MVGRSSGGVFVFLIMGVVSFPIDTTTMTITESTDEVTTTTTITNTTARLPSAFPFGNAFGVGDFYGGVYCKCKNAFIFECRAGSGGSGQKLGVFSCSSAAHSFICKQKKWIDMGRLAGTSNISAITDWSAMCAQFSNITSCVKFDDPCWTGDTDKKCCSNMTCVPTATGIGDATMTDYGLCKAIPWSLFDSVFRVTGLR